MSFRIGQDVYVGFCPASRCTPKATKYRCSVGVISSGPFPMEAAQPPHKGWWVLIDHQLVRAAEYLLEPFEPPTETHETEREVTA